RRRRPHLSSVRVYEPRLKPETLAQDDERPGSHTRAQGPAPAGPARATPPRRRDRQRPRAPTLVHLPPAEGPGGRGLRRPPPRPAPVRPGRRRVRDRLRLPAAGAAPLDRPDRPDP